MLRRLPLPPLRSAVLACLLSLSAACASSRPEATNPLAEAAARGETTSPEQLVAAAQELARRGDSVRAEHYLVAALEQGASRDEVIPLLVAVCLESSRLRTALEHAEPYLRAHPEDAELRLVVAAIYLGLDRHEAARAALEEVIRLRPDRGSARYLLGALLARHLHSPTDAALQFERYLELEPNGPHAAEVRSWLRSYQPEGSYQLEEFYQPGDAT